MYNALMVTKKHHGRSCACLMMPLAAVRHAVPACFAWMQKVAWAFVLAQAQLYAAGGRVPQHRLTLSFALSTELPVISSTNRLGCGAVNAVMSSSAAAKNARGLSTAWPC